MTVWATKTTRLRGVDPAPVRAHAPARAAVRRARGRGTALGPRAASLQRAIAQGRSRARAASHVSPRPGVRKLPGCGVLHPRSRQKVAAGLRPPPAEAARQGRPAMPSGRRCSRRPCSDLCWAVPPALDWVAGPGPRRRGSGVRSGAVSRRSGSHPLGAGQPVRGSDPARAGPPQEPNHFQVPSAPNEEQQGPSPQPLSVLRPSSILEVLHASAYTSSPSSLASPHCLGPQSEGAPSAAGAAASTARTRSRRAMTGSTHCLNALRALPPARRRDAMMRDPLS